MAGPASWALQELDRMESGCSHTELISFVKLLFFCHCVFPQGFAGELDMDKELDRMEGA